MFLCKLSVTCPVFAYMSVPLLQSLCLPVIQVHVPRRACSDEHPAGEHQCLLRSHHAGNQQRLCF